MGTHNISCLFLRFHHTRGVTLYYPVVATGMGAHFALPYIRQRIDAKKAPLTLDEAHEVIKMSMNTLYARDARSWPVYEVIKCDASGVVKSEKQTTDIVWKPYADYQQGRKH